MDQHKKQLAHKGLLLFLREFFTHPSAMGATFPSSNLLAKTIAQQIALPTNGYIVELGAGTGSITSGLLTHGIAAEKLIIIERSRAMATHLGKRFPQLKIINGDAQNLADLLNTHFHPVSAVVSSLPLRTLPKELVQKIGEQLENILDENGIFIQFTYNFWSKPLSPSPHFHCTHSHHVWWNLPSARVDVFKKNLGVRS